MELPLVTVMCACVELCDVVWRTKDLCILVYHNTFEEKCRLSEPSTTTCKMGKHLETWHKMITNAICYVVKKTD